MRLLFLAPLLCFLATSARGQTSADGASSSSPNFKMTGLAALSSNVVEYGLTQTNKDPGLLGQFWFNWGPQFRLGLSGMNVAYKNSESHFRLRLNGDIKVAFSSETSMTLKFTDERFFKPETRNGNILGVHFDFFGYGVEYDVISNFTGSETRATAASFSKAFEVFGDWSWDNRVGYLMLTNDAMTNYFFYETYIGKKPGAILYQVGASHNSGASQFDGAGDLMFMLKAAVTF